jgi:hypothetical protein
MTFDKHPERLERGALGDDERMTSRERQELMAVVRRREKLAKAQADVRAAELQADFEHQMASVYSWNDDAVWAEALRTAKDAVAEADAKVAARCQELGIPEQYRGGIRMYWSSGGQNAFTVRQTELRTVAKTQIAALAKTAKHRIEEVSVAAQEHLAAGELATEEAQTMLTALPTAAELMPTLNVSEIEQVLTKPKMGERQRYLDLPF